MTARFLGTLAVSFLWAATAHAVCLETTVRPDGKQDVISVSPGHIAVADEYERTELVLMISVLSERIVPGKGNQIGGTDYRVVPQEVFKGAPPRPLTLFSENSSGRFPLEVGRRYVVFVHREGTGYAVDNCGNSQLLEGAALVVEQLRQLRTK